MLKKRTLAGLQSMTLALVVAAALPSLGASSCGGGASDTGGGASSAIGLLGNSSSGSTTTIATGGSTNTILSNINAVQVIMSSTATGSFVPITVPSVGGVVSHATQFFNLDGSGITAGNIPAWFVGTSVFLTSTRTSTGNTPNPTTNGLQDTPCAYFDMNTDANPGGPNGYYTIDGYNTQLAPNDVDQCAGTAASELNQLQINIQIDRQFMNPTDNIQVVVKAEPINAPNTSPLPSGCVTNGFFDPTVCSNQVFTMSMRTAPGASAKPFYILFPSANAFDLLSESVLLPVNGNQGITTISIDRVKGGAVFYGLSVIRLTAP